MKRFIRGQGLIISEYIFSQLIKYIDSKRDQLWISPLVQIYKYDEEYNNTNIENVEENETVLKVTLSVDTNPNLYDQKLTLVITMANTNGVEKVLQNQEQIYDIHLNPSGLLINIKPINSDIYVHYN